jgi:hypothetical protein
VSALAVTVPEGRSASRGADQRDLAARLTAEVLDLLVDEALEDGEIVGLAFRAGIERAARAGDEAALPRELEGQLRFGGEPELRGSRRRELPLKTPRGEVELGLGRVDRLLRHDEVARHEPRVDGGGGPRPRDREIDVEGPAGQELR